jgi:hypothetical protein
MPSPRTADCSRWGSTAGALGSGAGWPAKVGGHRPPLQENFFAPQKLQIEWVTPDRFRAFFDIQTDNGILKGVKYLGPASTKKAPDILPHLKAYRLVKTVFPGDSPNSKRFETLLQ